VGRKTASPYSSLRPGPSVDWISAVVSPAPSRRHCAGVHRPPRHWGGLPAMWCRPAGKPLDADARATGSAPPRCRLVTCWQCRRAAAPAVTARWPRPSAPCHQATMGRVDWEAGWCRGPPVGCVLFRPVVQTGRALGFGPGGCLNPFLLFRIILNKLK
jgi:hypothetical protein